MNIIFCEDYEEMSRKAAAVIASQIILKPDSTLGLATGSTPIGLYDELVKKYNLGEISFSRIHTYNLDEYIGLAPTHEQSYAYFMNHHLLGKVDINMSNTHLPFGFAKDIEQECRNYTSKLASVSGGLDFQILGMGHNGHIGFNEPDSKFILDTHCIELTKETIEANSRFFGHIDLVPRSAITMGIRPIMNSKQVLFIVNGSAKAEILEKALFGDVTPNVPASILQMHRSLTVVADREALSVVQQLHPEQIY